MKITVVQQTEYAWAIWLWGSGDHTRREKEKHIQPFSWSEVLAPKKKEICHFNNSSHNFKRLEKGAQPWLYWYSQTVQQKAECCFIVMGKWVNSGLWPITKTFGDPMQKNKQDRIEWGQHVLPETEAPLTKDLPFIFIVRGVLQLNTAGWCGSKPWHCFRTPHTNVDWLCSRLQAGFSVGCLLQSQLWARSYLQEQWKVCHLLLLACLCGLSIQKNTPNVAV